MKCSESQATILMTLNPDASRFPYTLETDKSKMNSLSGNSVAMVFQIRYADVRRFVRKTGGVGF